MNGKYRDESEKAFKPLMTHERARIQGDRRVRFDSLCGRDCRPETEIRYIILNEYIREFATEID